MRYQRTQVYLPPQDHRRLLAEARERGISLAALIRETVSLRALAREAGRRGKGFDAIIGIATGEAGDITTDKRAYLADAVEERYRKKLGHPSRSKRRG